MGGYFLYISARGINASFFEFNSLTSGISVDGLCSA